MELLKTKDSGQMSFLSAHPGITRGCHYHHTKSEKFFVVRGQAKFAFKNILNGDYAEIFVSGDNPSVVDTIPGWSHSISNIGSDELIVMLWANEPFDPSKPDTIHFPTEL